MVKSPQELIAGWLSEAPDRQVLHQPVAGEVLHFTWRDIHDQASRIASALQDWGCEPGDRVAILSKNCAEWIISDLAIMYAGLVSVPIYPTANAGTISFVLQHSGAKVCIVGKLDSWASQQRALKRFCTLAMPYGDAEGKYEWQTVLREYPPIKSLHHPAPEELMTLLYTSGSTGDPKGAMHSYGNFSRAGEICGKLFGSTPQDRVLSYLPLSHCTERAYVESSFFHRGFEVYFAESLETFSQDLKRAQPTFFGSVPRLWKKFQLGVMEEVGTRKLDVLTRVPLLRGVVGRKVRQALGLAEARWLGSGTAPIAPALLQWWDRLGMPLREGWGMTESLAIGTALGPDENPMPGSVGKPLPGMEMRVSDEGELLLKGPVLMQGYYRDEEQTARVIRDGWLHTGDRGSIDEAGYVRITGRLKEVFKTAKGKYVAPVPLESLLAQNKHIELCCVTGSGLSQPVALVMCTERQSARLQSSLEATLAAVNQSLETHERLDAIIVVNDEWTPENGLLTPTLKLKRELIEARYAQEIEAAEPGVSFL